MNLLCSSFLGIIRMVKCLFYFCTFLSLLIAVPAHAQTTREVRINLTDQAGSVIVAATVKVRVIGAGMISCKPDDDAFVCDFPENRDVVFNVDASGFRPLRVEYKATEITCCEYVYVLPPSLIEENVVTILRTETRLADTAESIATIDRTQIANTAASTLDDALRQVPGFSIFRRSSSKNANPTTQGVSLRGVGASGASRTNVMFDGVPINDPFGGWVQWNRVSPIAVGSVEMLRGGASSLYGNSSLSGAIELSPRPVQTDDHVLSGEVFGGSQRTVSGSVFAGVDRNGWFGDVSGGHFQTRGFIPIEEAARGAVDSFAGVRSVNFSARVGRRFGDAASIFFRPTYFGESRTNGTPAQINRTHSRQFILGGEIGKKVKLDWRVLGGTQGYDQTFSAISADRLSEALTRLQYSPSQNFGYSATASWTFRSNTLLGGVEGRDVRGASDEIVYSSSAATSMVGSGGRERAFGIFVKDVLSIASRVVLSGSVRYDRWRNYRGFSVTRSLSSSAVTATSFVDRDEDAISPQGSVLVKITDEFSVHATASKSFRAPTLNELYRAFRVGNVLTLANADLLAERATNFEGGASYRRKSFGFRGTAFVTDIDHAVANVTLTTTPSLITRQRQNAGSTRSAGFEFDGDIRFGRVDINAGYLYADSLVKEFPVNPTLIDKLVPQVPQHQATFQVRYALEKWSFAVQSRASSEQFDDDLNTFQLEPFFQADVFASRRIGEKASVFAAIENVFNSRYSVGRTPLRTLSSPFSVRAGVRWN